MPSVKVCDGGGQLEHWLKLRTTEPESINPAFCKVAFGFEAAGLDTKILQKVSQCQVLALQRA